ncbi:serine hydrolase domain-containing protein [Aquimarina aquimarini]|uniref:serine hydrolase domain-containing protein n=1 Tax=Aquimarina aquimarini TaxID=1191734 RepID=UPI001F2ADD52|nr:serine hydrolase domain-containing protein [Aquimarina aquimarini]
MKKMRIFFISTFLIISYTLYWITEPFSINLFTQNPVSIIENKTDFKCNAYNTLINQGDHILDSVIKSKEFLGVSVGVSIDSCQPWLATAGIINKKSKQKPTTQSLFRIASISKPMTAVAILQLYEKGKLKLDVPIQTYLPEFPKKEKGDITIRQLLQHTSGIPHYKSKMGIFHFKNYDNCTDALKRFSNKKLAFKPGTSFLYSSYGYTVLGAIIEQVSGRSYQEYMKENIWIPSGMIHTDIEQKNLTYNNKAGLYIKTGIGFIRSPKNDLSYTYSGGGIISTAEDMLKFGEAILENELINSTTTQLMIALSNKEITKKEYTLGWDVWVSSKHQKVIEHSGTQVGVSSFFRIYFDKRVVVVSLANNLNSSEQVRNLTIKMANLVLENRS